MRILYLTFFAPPLNSIPSLRTQGFMKHLPEFGVEIDVLTRYYDPKLLKGDDFFITHSAIESEFNVNGVKKNQIVYSFFEENHKGINLFSQLPRGVKAVYAWLQKDLYHKTWISHAMNAYEEHLSMNRYDFIVASYHPLITLYTADIMSKKYRIPWIADFRDTYIGLGPETKFSIFYKKSILNPVLEGCSGIISVSEGVNQQINRYGTSRVQRKPKVVANNGIDMTDASLFDPKDESHVRLFEEIQKKSALLLLHTGTIYEGQNIDFFLDLLDRYNQKNTQPIRLICLGLTKNQINSDRLEKRGVLIWDRLSLQTSLFLQGKADVLILPAWYPTRYIGLVSKVFEYIHSGTPLLCSPNPVSDVVDFMKDFSHVVIADDLDSAEAYLNHMVAHRNFGPKQKNTQPKLYRRYWVEKMAQFIKELKRQE